MKIDNIKDKTEYEKNIENRSLFRYLIGLMARWKQHFKYDRAVRIAKRRGAKIGEAVSSKLCETFNIIL